MIIRGKIPEVKQAVRINSQWLKAMYYFDLIMPEQDSTMKGSLI